jgi:hypothetical protein
MVTDATHWKLHGPVRSLRSEIVEWDAERGDWGTPRFFQFVTFDAAGRVRQLDQRGAEQSIHRTNFVYDENGRLLRSEAGTAPGPYPYKRTWSYDERGRETATTVARDGGVEEVRSRSTYDDHGRRTDVATLQSEVKVDAYSLEGSEFGYSAPGAVSQTTRYDDAGRPVEVLFQGADGGVIRRITFTRDADGRVLTEEAEMAGAPLIPRQPGMSDDDVAKMQALVSHAFGAMRTTYEYDAAGRVVARAQQSGLLGEDRVTYRYDERGNPIEQRDVRVTREMHFEEDGTPRTSPDTTRIHDVRFAYVYDAHGNWTERTVSGRIREDAEFAPSNTERRTIEYSET